MKTMTPVRANAIKLLRRIRVQRGVPQRPLRDDMDTADSLRAIVATHWLPEDLKREAEAAIAAVQGENV